MTQNGILYNTKLGSYTTKSVRDMKKVSFPWLKNVCVKSRNWCNTEVLKLRFELKMKFFPNALLTICTEISFQSWEIWLYSFLTQDHCKLEILLDMSTFFKPQFWKSLQIVLCLFFAGLFKYVWTFCYHQALKG